MKSKKRVLLTVNPGLIEGRRFQTVRSMVTGLHTVCNLYVTPISEYDFKQKKLNAYRRVAAGKFERHGWIKPEADLWIVYTDGYWLDAERMGFKTKREFLDAQFDLHESGRVGKLINSVQAEKHCLKSWFARIDHKKYGVIPTHSFSQWSDVHDFLKREKTIVAKPDWGGAASGVVKLAGDADLDEFKQMMQETHQSLSSDYCFQPFVEGAEKRFWYVNGKCVGGRKIIGRPTPWSQADKEYRVVQFYEQKSKEYLQNIEAADRLCKTAEITIGSIDFIGDYINEINGAGTTFTQYEYSGMKLIADARQPLVDYLVSIAQD